LSVTVQSPELVEGGASASTGSADGGTERLLLSEDVSEPVVLESEEEDTLPPELEDIDDTETDPEVNSQADILDPLEDGSWIADKYCIIQNQIQDNLRIYDVEDHGICPTCGTEIIDDEHERFCTACGADLENSDQPWPIVQLQEMTDQNSEQNFLAWAGRYFKLIDDSTAADESQTTPLFDTGVNLLAGQRSHVGIARADQPDEDSIFSLTISGIYESHARPTIGLYLVADGMGGHGDGEIASRLAAETVSNFLLQTTIMPLLRGEEFSHQTITAHIDAAIQDANRKVLEGAHARGNDMGTTITLLMVIDEVAYVANVGDSRTYLWGQHGLGLITEDHSTVFKLFKAGQLDEEAIYTHPKRSEIYRSLGFLPDLEVDHFVLELTPDTTFILCCDGLWEMLRTEGIADVLMLGMADPQAVCDEFVKRANQAGGEDNISVVVVRAG